MKITARLKKGAIYENRYVGTKNMTKDYRDFDVTESELALIEQSDIAEVKPTPNPKKKEGK